MIYDWRTGRYCVFKNFVHLVFVTKYRKNVFTPPMLDTMKVAAKESCLNMGGELIEFGGEDDHIHLMVVVPPTPALCFFAGRIKGATSFAVRKAFKKELAAKLWGNHLWSPSYCAVSCGGATLDTVKHYIQNQRKPASIKGVRQSLQETGRSGERSRVRTGKVRARLTPS